MIYRKGEWGNIPAFVMPPLRESFASSFSKECSVIYVSMPLLIDALHVIRRFKCNEFHFTHDLFMQVSRQRYLQQKSYLPVKVTDFVLMQKDIEMQIGLEAMHAKPCVERLSQLREVFGRLEPGRGYVTRVRTENPLHGDSIEPDISVPYTGLDL